jgi:hypothetical protein
MNRLRINLTLAFPVAVFASAFEVGILVDPSSGWTWSDALWLWLSEGAMFLVFLSVALESFIRIGWVSPIRLQSMVGRAKMFAWLGVAICLGTIGFVLREVPRAEGVALGTDVLLITLDTTRADALSVYGNTAVKTPALDALAAQGVRYERAFATAPQTGPSHLSILTGLHPFETGVYSNATEVGNVEMIAGKFQEEGWSTAAFVSGYPLHSRFGFDQGFNVYDALFGGAVGLLNRAFNKVIFGGLASLGLDRGG